MVFRLGASEAPQTISFGSLPDRTYGDPPFAVNATASSGLPVSFSTSGSCSVAGDLVSITGVGICTVTASQIGDSTHAPAPEASQVFEVTYAFTGFLRPIWNSPALNRVRAGRSVPIRFELGGDPGAEVIADGYPIARQLDCHTLAPIGEAEQARTAGSSSVEYQPGTGRYTYVWKSKKRWAGTCRELALELDDGTEHRAYFSFGSSHQYDNHAQRP